MKGKLEVKQPEVMKDMDNLSPELQDWLIERIKKVNE